LEKTTVSVASHIIFDAKAVSCQKWKEIKVYEEISGVICNDNVSCDFFIDGLHSIRASAGEGSGRDTWRGWSTWSDWSTGSTWSTCPNTSKIVDARELN